MKALAPCGTYGAFQRHKRRGEPPCRPCQDAHAEYMRQFRSNRADVRDYERRSNRARHRAHARLAQTYPADFRRLWLEELESASEARRPKVTERFT